MTTLVENAGIPSNTIIGCANMAAKNISQYEYTDLTPYKGTVGFDEAFTNLEAFENLLKGGKYS